MITIKEHNISIGEYLYTEKENEVHLFFSGFVPTYNPIICVKGKPESMKELLEKLEDILGVKITVVAPAPPAIGKDIGE